MPRAAKLVVLSAAAGVACVLVAWVLFFRGDGHFGPSAPSGNSGAAPAVPPRRPNVVNAGPVRPDIAAMRLIADPLADYSARLKAVDGLDGDLRAKLVADLINIVKDPAADETIRNNLLNKLESQKQPLGTLGPLLQEMYADRKQNRKWRGYCLQHMVPVWRLEPEHRGTLVDVLFGVLEEEQAASAEAAVMYETAMLSLSKIGSQDPAVAARVAKLAAERVAAREKDPERAVTAMHVATGAGDKSILPEARKLAADDKALARLRMSAIAALGSLGGKEDEAVLAKLATGPDGRIKDCAKLNLETLKGRLAK